MPIKHALVSSFKQEILDGIHESGDTYKIALFTNAAKLDESCTGYEAQAGEVAGKGYKPGGIVMNGRNSGTEGGTGYVTFDNPLWPNASFTAHGALIYNASKDNRAVAVIDFGQDHSCSNGPFVISLPPAGEKAILRVE